MLKNDPERPADVRERQRIGGQRGAGELHPAELCSGVSNHTLERTFQTLDNNLWEISCSFTCAESGTPGRRYVQRSSVDVEVRTAAQAFQNHLPVRAYSIHGKQLVTECLIPMPGHLWCDCARRQVRCPCSQRQLSCCSSSSGGPLAWHATRHSGWVLLLDFSPNLTRNVPTRKVPACLIL